MTSHRWIVGRGLGSPGSHSREEHPQLPHLVLAWGLAMLGSGFWFRGLVRACRSWASTIVAGEPGHQFLWVLGVNILKEPCGGHASKRRGRATAVADVHLVPAYGVVETLCAGHKNEPGRAFASVGPQHSVRPRGSCWVPVSQLMVMASGWTRKGLPEPGRRRVSGRLLAQ